MKMLITAVGRRVQLVRHFKKHFEVIGVDCSNIAPASYFTDSFFVVPSCLDPGYKKAILDICIKESIDLVVSVHDQECMVLDDIRDELEKLGVFLMLPGKRALDICNDKWKTYMFFAENGFDTPESFLEFSETAPVFPLFIKPRVGMGSQNSHKIATKEELDFYYSHIHNPIIQKYVEGVEYTLDCICDNDGSVICVVPRVRMEVKAGEVQKSRIVRDEKIIQKGKEVCEKLNYRGPLTIQCFKTEAGRIIFTEINPRMGGGVPLSFEAGVDYGRIFEDMVTGRKVEPIIGKFNELTMLRYDEAVFI